MKKKLGYEEKKLDLDELYDIILSRQMLFYENYHIEPTYVVIPVWVYICLREQSRKIAGFEYIDNNTVEKLFGLRIISTPSKDSIWEIELL